MGEQVVQQNAIDALPLTTQVLFGWQGGSIGLFLGITGLSMIAVNLAVAYGSAYVRDRCSHKPVLHCLLIYQVLP